MSSPLIDVSTYNLQIRLVHDRVHEHGGKSCDDNCDGLCTALGHPGGACANNGECVCARSLKAQNKEPRDSDSKCNSRTTNSMLTILDSPSLQCIQVR